MRKITAKLSVWKFFLFILPPFITSCSSLGHPNYPASPQNQVKATLRLDQLPEALGKINAAVYQFGDFSGQKKQAPSSTFSTAVTQGAENYLIQSLLETQWFTLFERTKLSNLNTERKILNLNLAGKNLPQLQAANILFEGGIVSYDFNVKTGGKGARLLGIGGSTKYREDLIGASLRVVNVANGAIMHNVQCNAQAFSRARDFGVFAYVDDDKILELELGKTLNKPIQEALSEAIDYCVRDIVLEGIKLGSWQPKNIEELSPFVSAGFLSAGDINGIQGRINQSRNTILDIKKNANIPSRDSNTEEPNPTATTNSQQK